MNNSISRRRPGVVLMATAALVLSPLTAFGAEAPSDPVGTDPGQSATGDGTATPSEEVGPGTPDPAPVSPDPEAGTDDSGDEDTQLGGDSPTPDAGNEQPGDVQESGSRTVGDALAAGTTTINLLNITDFHGHLSRSAPGGVTVDPGAAVLACMVDQESTDDGTTLRLSTGDNIGGSAYVSAIQDDDPTVAVLNAMGIQASAVGNHEFDQGFDVLLDRIAGGSRTDAQIAAGLAANYVKPDFPYLGANLGTDQLEPYTVLEAGGLTVGIIGTVTDELPSLVNPAGIAGLTITDAVDTTNAIAANLSDGDPANGEADIVVALIHQDMAATVSRFSSDVDAVFGGHSHVDFTQAGSDTAVPAVQAGSFGQALGQIELTVDTTTKDVVSSDVNVYDVADMDAACADTPDPGIAAIVTAAEARADELGGQPAAQLGGTFRRGSAVLDAAATAPSEARGVESTLGDLIADSVREGSTKYLPEKADIGVMNAGGIRANLTPDEDGWVTKADLFTVQPFGNSMAYVSLTGDQVVQMLEQQWQPDGSSRPMLKLALSSNVVYVFDNSQPRGSKILQVSIDGEPIDPAATYVVAGNTFLLQGGDNFDVFKDVEAVDTGFLDLELFTDHLTGLSTPASPLDVRDGAIGFENAGDLPDSFEEGGTYTLDLSSLSFTDPDDQLRASSVSVCLLDGETSQVLATAPVDNSDIVDGDPVALEDRFGVASVTFTVPTGLAEGQELAVCDLGAGFVTAPLVFATVAEGSSPTPTPTPTPTPSPDDTKAPTPSGSPAATGGSGTLARTGMDGGLLPAALLVLLAGASLAALNRRLRRD